MIKNKRQMRAKITMLVFDFLTRKGLLKEFYQEVGNMVLDEFPHLKEKWLEKFKK